MKIITLRSASTHVNGERETAISCAVDRLTMLLRCALPGDQAHIATLDAHAPYLDQWGVNGIL